MRIAVLSGKGGTGKTFISVNLACAANEAIYADCDVEEPNGYLFLKPEVVTEQKVDIMLPKYDFNKCTGCRTCVDFCKYNALAYIKQKILIFKEVCHSCGGCVLLCPEEAMDYSKREIGVIQEGISRNVRVLTGILNTGEASGIPIIKKMIRQLPEDEVCMIDCPPGSACSVMECIKAADYCILVTEPTLFGLHDLSMVYDLVRLFKKPSGVILNKCMPRNNPSKEYCTLHDVKILAEIPFNNELGGFISNGDIAVRNNEKFKKLFHHILNEIKKEAPDETVAHTER